MVIYEDPTKTQQRIRLALNLQDVKTMVGYELQLSEIQRRKSTLKASTYKHDFF